MPTTPIVQTYFWGQPCLDTGSGDIHASVSPLANEEPTVETRRELNSNPRRSLYILSAPELAKLHAKID